MDYIMKLNANAFNKIINGYKRREYRLYDEKRQKIKIGDYIIFQKLPDLSESIKVEVVNIYLYSNFVDAITNFFKDDFSKKHSNIDDAVNSFYEKGYYTKEEEKEYGVVVFEFKM